jgi:hypothetical protein
MEGEGGPKSKSRKLRKSRKGSTKWFKPWSWPKLVAHVFRMLYAAFADAPVLQHFDPKLPLMLIMDALDFTYVGILFQLATNVEGTERHWRPIAYYSQKSLRPKDIT